MNGNQQRKSLGYTLIFLRNEIESLKESIKTAKDPLIKPILEKRLKELEVDYEIFQDVEKEFI